MESDGGGGDSAGGLVSSGAAPPPGGPANPAVGAAAGGLVLPGDVESVGRYLTAAKAESTRKAYDADFRAWSAWAEQRGFIPVTGSPPAHGSWTHSTPGCSASTVARLSASLGWAQTRAEASARSTTSPP